MLSIIILVAVILLDQLSKYFVVQYLKPVGSVTVIENILDLTYVENTGAAFGSFSENRVVFMTASVVIIAVLGFVMFKFRGQNKLFDVCLALIVGGGIGNMIDRIRLGYVVDFIDFCAFDFWKYIFNVADSAVVVGCILAIAYVLFDRRNKVLVQKSSGEDDVNE